MNLLVVLSTTVDSRPAVADEAKDAKLIVIAVDVPNSCFILAIFKPQIYKVVFVSVAVYAEGFPATSTERTLPTKVRS